MELVIQKAVELGAFAVVPVAAKRCVVKPVSYTHLPTKKSQIFSTAADNQTAVDINVLQGESVYKRQYENRLRI